MAIPDFAVVAIILFGLVGCATPGTEEEAPELASGGTASFQAVRPVLEERCLPCHHNVQVPGMVDLSSRKAAVATGALNSNNPSASPLLVAAHRGDGDPGAMPPTGHAMTGDQLRILEKWLAVGAPWPSGGAGALRPASGAEPRSN